ncbi:ferritin [Pontibacillus yanchengensis]|uniref:Ferritin n=1 Tax=Pontibacillus yanchengensis TaxID=462910 RepID=A0A6I5A081_9BACI|nr:ferritin [Pontibacillus yanchengensis]MYL33593.1 ferritin [Pontibacillus yanchengensis]
MLNEQILKMLNNLIQIEHVSSTLYLAMAAHMAKKNYTGMASWLRIQSGEERTHMLRLIDYVTDRDGTVEIKSMPAQPTDFGNPLETFKKVLEHEQFVTDSYRQAYTFTNQKDQQTADLLQQFLREQVEEVAQSQTIVDRLTIADNNPAALLILDQELGQRAAPTPGA